MSDSTSLYGGDYLELDGLQISIFSDDEDLPSRARAKSIDLSKDDAEKLILALTDVLNKK